MPIGADKINYETLDQTLRTAVEPGGYFYGLMSMLLTSVPTRQLDDPGLHKQIKELNDIKDALVYAHRNYDNYASSSKEMTLLQLWHKLLFTLKAILNEAEIFTAIKTSDSDLGVRNTKMQLILLARELHEPLNISLIKEPLADTFADNSKAAEDILTLGLSELEERVSRLVSSREIDSASLLRSLGTWASRPEAADTDHFVTTAQRLYNR